MLGINRAYPFWLEFEGSTWLGIPRVDGIARDLVQALQDVGGVSLGCDLRALQLGSASSMFMISANRRMP